MKRFTKSMLALAAIPAILVAVPANAALVLNGTGVGTTLTTGGASGGTQSIDFNGFTSTGGAAVAGLTGKLTLTFDSIVGNAFKFNYIVDNTSSFPITASRISSFGFDVDPNLSSASSTGTFNLTMTPSSSIPNGIGQVDACFRQTGGNCNGGGNGGIDINEANGTGDLFLNFASPVPSSITLSNFYFRYQAINAPTLGIQGGSASGRPTVPLPEPAAWMMMILGFGGIGFAMRKRNHASQTRVRFG